MWPVSSGGTVILLLLTIALVLWIVVKLWATIAPEEGWVENSRSDSSSQSPHLITYAATWQR